MLILVCSVDLDVLSVRFTGVVFEGERSYTRDRRKWLC